MIEWQKPKVRLGNTGGSRVEGSCKKKKRNRILGGQKIDVSYTQQQEKLTEVYHWSTSRWSELQDVPGCEVIYQWIKILFKCVWNNYVALTLTDDKKEKEYKSYYDRLVNEEQEGFSAKYRSKQRLAIEAL